MNRRIITIFVVISLLYLSGIHLTYISGNSAENNKNWIFKSNVTFFSDTIPQKLVYFSNLTFTEDLTLQNFMIPVVNFWITNQSNSTIWCYCPPGLTYANYSVTPEKPFIQDWTIEINITDAANLQDKLIDNLLQVGNGNYMFWSHLHFVDKNYLLTFNVDSKNQSIVFQNTLITDSGLIQTQNLNDQYFLALFISGILIILFQIRKKKKRV